MEAVFVLLPLALLIAAISAGFFVWAAKSGQFDDLETPAVRILFDDHEGATRPQRHRDTELTNGATKTRRHENEATKTRRHEYTKRDEATETPGRRVDERGHDDTTTRENEKQSGTDYWRSARRVSK